MGQVPAKQFPSPVSYGQTGQTNTLNQASATPQMPQMQFPSLSSFQAGGLAQTGTQTPQTTIQKPKPISTQMIKGL